MSIRDEQSHLEVEPLGVRPIGGGMDAQRRGRGFGLPSAGDREGERLMAARENRGNGAEGLMAAGSNKGARIALRVAHVGEDFLMDGRWGSTVDSPNGTEVTVIVISGEIGGP